MDFQVQKHHLQVGELFNFLCHKIHVKNSKLWSHIYQIFLHSVFYYNKSKLFFFQLFFNFPFTTRISLEGKSFLTWFMECCCISCIVPSVSILRWTSVCHMYHLILHVVQYRNYLPVGFIHNNYCNMVMGGLQMTTHERKSFFNTKVVIT